MTTSAEAQEIEARLERLSAARVAGGPPGDASAAASPSPQPVDPVAELASIDAALAVLAVPQEEWEVLYRERLQVERDLLAGQRPGAAFPGGGPKTLATAGRDERGPRADRLPSWASTAIAAAGFLMVAADLLLALVDRRRSD